MEGNSAKAAGADVIVLEPGRQGLDVEEVHRRLAAAGLAGSVVPAREATARLANTGKRLGRLTVDQAGKRIYVDHTELRLSPRERELLIYLLQRPGVAVTRSRLLHDVWSREAEHTGKTVDVHVRWLRQRLAPFGNIGFKIATVRGTGYRVDTATPESGQGAAR